MHPSILFLNCLHLFCTILRFPLIYLLFVDEVVVGLERTFYKVNEDMPFLTVCAMIINPSAECAIEFPFQIKFSLSSNTAGKNIQWNLQ